MCASADARPQVPSWIPAGFGVPYVRYVPLQSTTPPSQVRGGGRQGGRRDRFDECTIGKAHGRGCGRVEWYVLTWNTPAITFYEKNFGRRMDWYLYRLSRDQMEKYRKKNAGK